MSKAKKKTAAKGKPQASQPLPRVNPAEVEKLVQLAFGNKAVLVHADHPTPPATTPEVRNRQILLSFFDGVDFTRLDDDIEGLRDLHDRLGRRGSDDALQSLERIISLLETLQDTGETCGLLKT